MQSKDNQLRWTNIGLTILAMVLPLLSLREFMQLMSAEGGLEGDAQLILAVSAAGVIVGVVLNILIQYNILKVVLELFGLEMNRQWLYLLYLVTNLVEAVVSLLIPVEWHLANPWLNVGLVIAYTCLLFGLIQWYLQTKVKDSIFNYKGAIIAVTVIKLIIPLWSVYQLLS